MGLSNPAASKLKMQKNMKTATFTISSMTSIILLAKKWSIFGGGDSAVDWALMLEPIAEKVSIIHRRDKFRAHEHSVENLKIQKWK